MAIDFTTAAEAQAQQNNAGANTETAPITQEYMLTQINNSIKVRVAGGSSYADFNFSIFKSGKYTDLLLYYAGLVEETNKKEPKTATTAQKYTGIPTNNPMDGKTNNWWYENIDKYLTDKGYKWTFLYYRDQELPFGFRVSWSKDSSNTEANPIWSAQNKEFPYLILPENRFVLQQASKVEVAETQPAGQEATSEKLKNFFTIINNKITNAAQLGNNTVLIPWTAFGTSLDTQVAIIQLADGVTIPSETTAMEPFAIHNLFNYGSLNSNKVYGSAVYRVYNINELKESKDGIAPIVFFTTSNANSEYYIFNPTTDANSDGIKDFTLKTLLAKGGYSSIALYADIDNNGNSYCAGIAIGWSDGNATTAAKAYYTTQKNAYDATQVITYHFEDIPVYSDYSATSKHLNATYVSKLIELTASKMRGAFEKGERVIRILWTEIDSKNPGAVRDRWRGSTNYSFDGTFTTSLYTSGLTDCGGTSPGGYKQAYDTLLNGQYINSGSVVANTKYTYIWTYMAYKDTEMSTSDSTLVQIPSDLKNSCGITVYLTNCTPTGSTTLNASNITDIANQLNKQVKDQLKIADPSKK